MFLSFARLLVCHLGGHLNRSAWSSGLLVLADDDELCASFLLDDGYAPEGHFEVYIVLTGSARGQDPRWQGAQQQGGQLIKVQLD